MEQRQIEEVLECLPKNPTKFYYFKDFYALMLLSYAVGKGMSKHEIKKTGYSRLINKPIVKDLLQDAGTSIISEEILGSFWPEEYHCYLLTLDKWGGQKDGARFYNQTSRPGWNLVLQLNFSNKHDREYERLIKPQQYAPFVNYGHPVSLKNDLNTLAWARIDFDLDRGEALVEEIQNDWIRLALKSRQHIGRYKNSQRRRYIPYYIKELGCNEEGLSNYIENVLKPHAVMWEETVLMSAIWFLKEQVGITDIFYHTFDLGCQLKRIDGTRPPRSLYTRLPEKFCFEKTERIPGFLLERNNRKTVQLLKDEHREFYLLKI